jgi:hypothetical protein
VRTGVHVQPNGTGYAMWYAGGSDWVGEKPRYSLRHVHSADGVRWPDGGEVVLAPQGDDELGFGRPCVLGDRMWYSLRTVSKGYRMGYAESDGTTWERRDDLAGIEVSTSGWDSEMVCLSCVLETPHGTYLFYNGNGYGTTGFGVAVLDG